MRSCMKKIEGGQCAQCADDLSFFPYNSLVLPSHIAIWLQGTQFLCHKCCDVKFIHRFLLALVSIAVDYAIL